MPVDFLQDEDESPLYPPFDMNTLRRRSAVPADLPMPPAPTGQMNAGASPLPPDMSQGVTPNAPLPAPDPVELNQQRVAEARKRTATALANKPVPKKPGVLQAIAAGALGAGVGWSNAAGRARQPI